MNSLINRLECICLQKECWPIFIRHWIISIKKFSIRAAKMDNLKSFFSFCVISMLLFLNVRNSVRSVGIGICLICLCLLSFPSIRKYPFSSGDLQICVDVLRNYLEANVKIPWEDLRYIFGEIMYGGHITDDWDRRLCRNYLEAYLNPNMFDGDLFLATDFPSPPPLDYKGYHAYIDDKLPSESPKLYGLHPNAEIDFLSQTSEKLFRTLIEISPRDNPSMAHGQNRTMSRDEKVKFDKTFSIVEFIHSIK